MVRAVTSCRPWAYLAAGMAACMAAAALLLSHAALPDHLGSQLFPTSAITSIWHQGSQTHNLERTSQYSSNIGEAQRSFSIVDDRFVRDGTPLQLLSGSIHYHRIPPDLWRDRLTRVKALGLNAVQLYVPWNFHQPTPGAEGILPFQGWQDLPGFIRLAGELELMVLVRPGPYICAEWEFGGLPAWLLAQNSSMALRSSDPGFLAAVNAWWSVLLPALAPLTYDNGGPIIMVQIENEYGSYGSDKAYLRHLLGHVRQHMGQQVIAYTVDNASLLSLVAGTLPGDEVLTTVDFGPRTNVKQAFALQKRFNSPGKSPAFCVEYYTGWLTHWGEPMAKTTAEDITASLQEILSVNNNTGSVNLYMAHGGTNFGPWAGANLFNSIIEPSQWQQDGKQQQGAKGSTNMQEGLEVPGPETWRLRQAVLQQQQQQRRQPSSGSDGSSVNGRELFQPHITSYDYNCPVGEAGTSGQLGMGGTSKFDAIRTMLAAFAANQTVTSGTAVTAAGSADVDGLTHKAAYDEAQKVEDVAHAVQLPPLPPPVPLKAYEPIEFTEGLYVLDALHQLSISCRGSTYCSKQLLGQQHQQQQQQSADAIDDAGGQNAIAKADMLPVFSQSQYPQPMELYGQYYGLIAYETHLGPELSAGGVLEFVAHDTAYVFLDGRLLGRSYRSAPATIVVPPATFDSEDRSTDEDAIVDSVQAKQGQTGAGTAEGATTGSSSSNKDEANSEQQQSNAGDVKLTAAAATSKKLLLAADSKSKMQKDFLKGDKDSTAGQTLLADATTEAAGAGLGSSVGRLLQLLVWPMGRNNFALFGSDFRDYKGLVGNVTIKGQVLQNWTVHHLCLQVSSGSEKAATSGADAGFAVLNLPWRPLAASSASEGGGGAGMFWRKKIPVIRSAAKDSSGSKRPLLYLPGVKADGAHQDRVTAGRYMGVRSSGNHGRGSGDSSSSSNGHVVQMGRSNITAFISTLAEAQAQAVIAAAAEAASGSGPATAAARGVANIRAGLASEHADAGMSVSAAKGPLLLRGTLEVPKSAGTRNGSDGADAAAAAVADDGGWSRPADTFLYMGNGWGRGELWVNGQSLGRYWSDQGPQMTLYLPGSFLKAGELNEVVVLELDGKVPDSGPSIKCVDQPDFSGPPGGPQPL